MTFRLGGNVFDTNQTADGASYVTVVFVAVALAGCGGQKVAGPAAPPPGFVQYKGPVGQFQLSGRLCRLHHT